MLRFAASEKEIVALVRFLAKRAPSGLYMVPLEALRRDDLRFRRTPRPFLTLLRETSEPLQWGMLPLAPSNTAEQTVPFSAIATTRPSAFRKEGVVSPSANTAPAFRIDPDLAGLILLSLGAPTGLERTREGILATRDPLPVRPGTSAALPENTPLRETHPPNELRNLLVEKCARRFRRRAEKGEGGRWIVTPSTPLSNP